MQSKPPISTARGVIELDNKNGELALERDY